MKIRKTVYLPVNSGGPEDIFLALKNTDKIPEHARIKEVYYSDSYQIEGGGVATVLLNVFLVFEWEDDE